jgi:hypothetical protein
MLKQYYGRVSIWYDRLCSNHTYFIKLVIVSHWNKLMYFWNFQFHIMSNITWRWCVASGESYSPNQYPSYHLCGNKLKHILRK